MKEIEDIENCKLQIANCNSPSRRRGFTLVELLIVITIIALLAGAVLGALAKTREVARGDATKATIAKLHDLVMRQLRVLCHPPHPAEPQRHHPAADAETVCHAPHAGPAGPDADGNARTLVRCHDWTAATVRDRVNAAQRMQIPSRRCRPAT